MKNWFYTLALVFIAVIAYRHYHSAADVASDNGAAIPIESNEPNSSPAGESAVVGHPRVAVSSKTVGIEIQKTQPRLSAPTDKALALEPRPTLKTVKGSKLPEDKRHIARFVVEDGVAVTEGDVVLGEPVGGDGSGTGYAATPDMHLWPTHEIPLFIQPSVLNPERVQQAVALFSATAVRFVPYTDQADAVVFEQGTGACKSYVGHIGGKQPLWISPNCGPPEIAHELMHALGFIHEQNRTDRDSSIQVLSANVDETYQDNFAKLPQDFMVISGLGPFDFDSIMIYPTSMFSKNGGPTMESVVKGQTINPSRSLSTEDVNRVNQIYSHR